MSALKRAAVVVVIVFAAAQFVRPSRANPPTDPSRTIQAHAGTPAELGAVLTRSCRDCHSNETVWPWYTGIAPLSWLMAYGVTQGRKVLNFSDWAAYSPERQAALLLKSCQDVRAGKMPGAYRVLRPEVRLSPGDIETICAASAVPQNGRTP